MSAQDILDQAYSLPRIEALAAEPAVYAERLARDVDPLDHAEVTLADLLEF
jgi:hypothetical protein